ncbi:MAG: alcohol dehydrogenase catalytic domain-containing protein [Clostridia bacterium]
MQALIWEAPELMRMGEREEPVARPGWVVMRVGAVGICGSELGAYLGHNELRVPPLVMGHEWAGEVVAVGSTADEPLIGRTMTANPLISCGQCRACRRGERQLCPERRIIGIDYPGAFAERVAVPVTALHPVPDVEAGALVEPLACAVRAVEQGRVRPGDAVLVFGAGVIGLFAAFMAQRAGAGPVAVVDPNQTRLARAGVFGASALFNPREVDVPEALRAAVPDGFDVAIDAVGSLDTRRAAVDSARRGGRVVFIGLHEPGAALPGNRMVRDEVSVTGSFCYLDENFRVAAEMAAGGAIPDRAGWCAVRPLDAGQEAFLEQARGLAPFSKILLTP